MVASSPTAPESGAAFRGPASCRVAGSQAGGARSAATLPLEHAILGVRLAPVHGLLHMVLHAEPLLVAHGDAAVAPLVVQSTLRRVTQRLLRLLKKTKSNNKIALYLIMIDKFI